MQHQTPAIVELMRRPRDLEAAPERLILVVRHVDDGRFLFARWPDWPQPALLALDPPHPDEGFAGGIGAVLGARMGLELRGDPLLAPERWPARMRHPYMGGEGIGWLRPVAVQAAGVPRPDALLEEVVALARSEAERALSTDLERVLFRAGAALLEDQAAT